MKKIIYGLSVLAMALASCHQQQPERVGVALAPGMVKLTSDQFAYVKMDTAKAMNDQSELTLNGKVSFDQNKVIKVYPVAGGNVSKVYVNMGDYVHKGDALALIGGGDVSAISGQYAVSKSNVELAKKNLDVARELYKTNVYSEKDVLSAENEYKKAMAEETKSKSYIKMMGLGDESKGGESYTITAPADGYVVEKNISENTLIRPDNSNNLFTISSLKTVWVVADLYENDIARIHEGDKVDIHTIAYPDRIFSGKIEQIGNFLDPVSRVVKVKVVLDNTEGLLKPEMYASVKVTCVMPGKVVEVPTKSLVLDGDHYCVMVFKNDHEFEKRRVNIIRNLDERTLIGSGLAEGEKIVTDGSLLVASNNATF